jgi:hypothetical protein
MMAREATEKFYISRQSPVVSKTFAATGRVGADASSAQPSEARLPPLRLDGGILPDRANSCDQVDSHDVA